MDNKITWLTRKELGAHLGVSQATVDRGIRHNTWPYNKRVKVGGRVYFHPSILTEMNERALSGMAVVEAQNE